MSLDQGWGRLQRHDYNYNYTMITKNDYDYDYSEKKPITVTIMIMIICSNEMVFKQLEKSLVITYQLSLRLFN